MLIDPMKKVLILAYDFPPYVSVAAMRPYYWFENFKSVGYEPIVVTRNSQKKYGDERDFIEKSIEGHTISEQLDCGVLIKTPFRPSFANRLLRKHGHEKFKLLRKILTGSIEISQFYLPLGPKRILLKEAQEYLKQHKVDCIIATGEPFVLFKYASKLSKQFKTPWIADYRDPWAKNKMNNLYHLAPKFTVRLERRTVQSALHITTVGEHFSRILKEIHRRKTIHILTNGFDSDILEIQENIPQNSDKLNLAFVGTIHDWHPYIVFLNTLNAFVSSNPEAKLKMNFYGINRQPELEDLIRNDLPLLSDIVEFHNRLPNKELIENLATNSLLLLFNYYSFTGTKIYDYLAVKRKILLCFENEPEALKLKAVHYDFDEYAGDKKNVQLEIIRETKAGIILTDKSHLYEQLSREYETWEKNHFIPCQSSRIATYSRYHQLVKLSKLFP
jgi:glycosyltransferase involved in cell wall biosynthesis